ncbi:MAG: rhodanese-like domain-containing protein [Verrucomicrobiota bacterium]
MTFKAISWMLVGIMLVGSPALSVAQDTKPGAPAQGTTVKHITSATADKLLQEKKDVVVLDVRTPREFTDGHIKGAKNIDFNDRHFADHLGKLDKGTTYLVHCASGGRSGRSLEVFKKLGFKAIYHMDDGFNGWKSAGKPVEK